MAKFTDNSGQEWQVIVDTWTLRAVKNNAGVLLTSLLEENATLYAQLYSDPILLADIVWPLIEDQAKERNVTMRDFGADFTGQAVTAARDAVVEATVDFFDPQTRLQAMRIIGKIQEVATTLRDQANEAIENIDPLQAVSSIE